MDVSETTILLRDQRPQNIESNFVRRRNRIKEFQCCICAILLSIVVAIVVLSIAYSISSEEIPSNSTTPIPDNSTPISPLNDLIILHRVLPLNDEITPNSTVSFNELKKAIFVGKTALQERDKFEANATILGVDTPSFRHQLVTSTLPKAYKLSRMGYANEHAAKYLNRNKTNVDKICISGQNITSDMPKYCYNSTFECNILYKYRSYNGTCNNLNYPLEYGVTFLPFRRSIPPDYSDGISAPRMGHDNKPLPSARTVSQVVHRPYYKDDPKFSVMLAVWGQFLDHDITATALSKGANSTPISCCSEGSEKHPECFPVFIDSLDPLRGYNITCMEFVRSAPAPTCYFGAREQMNQATSFIDGSVVYGSDNETVHKLRTLKGGQLKMYITEDNRTLLPVSEDLQDGCNRADASKKGRYCFLSGDTRANENLHLTTMHLLWARNHNDIASNLSKLNPHWSDERIFQEARRIIGAQMQHITYREFLPILLGPSVMSNFSLAPLRSGYFKKYNDTLQPNVANHFAAAAFRFAHTLIPGMWKMIGNDTSSPEYVQMHTMLFNPFSLYVPGELDRAINGALNTNIQASDPYFTSELKDHLFERDNDFKRKPKLCGLDLVSLNIQRGRDHGLPGYTKWREHCGFSKIESFENLTHIFDKNSLDNIKAVYANVHDIDLYSGALSEKPIKESILGPTLTCLILDQFIRLKHADRFWYENPQKPAAFSQSQLNEIRKTSLAQVICQNSDNVKFVQPYVMEKIRNGNRNTDCSKLQKMNLKFWKETLHKPEVSASIQYYFNADDLKTLNNVSK